MTGNPGLRVCQLLFGVALAALATLAAAPAAGAAAEAALSGALLIFVFIHLYTGYRLPRLVTFVLVAGAIAFAIEAISVATGFPFGQYTHHLTGPKPLGIPIPVVLGWIAVSWCAWMIARAVLGYRNRVSGFGRVSVPLVAAFVVAGYDFVIDPLGSTIRNWYSYDTPAGVTGVPAGNYLGWLLTGWLIFQVLALLRWDDAAQPVTSTRSYWVLPSLFWIATAAQPAVLLLHPGSATVVRGATTYLVDDVLRNSAITALLTMVFVALVAIFRVCDDR